MVAYTVIKVVYEKSFGDIVEQMRLLWNKHWNYCEGFSYKIFLTSGPNQTNYH